MADTLATHLTNWFLIHSSSLTPFTQYSVFINHAHEEVFLSKWLIMIAFHYCGWIEYMFYCLDYFYLLTHIFIQWLVDYASKIILSILELQLSWILVQTPGSSLLRFSTYIQFINLVYQLRSWAFFLWNRHIHNKIKFHGSL